MDPYSLNHLTPLQAWELLKGDSGALFVDIRSDMEYLLVGHPIGAVHVPWIDEPSWSVNQNFATEVRKLTQAPNRGQARHGRPIVLICRSGKRSIEAGRSLLEAGLCNVCHIQDGFEGELNVSYHRSCLSGWRFHGLPWEQC